MTAYFESKSSKTDLSLSTLSINPDYRERARADLLNPPQTQMSDVAFNRWFNSTLTPGLASYSPPVAAEGSAKNISLAAASELGGVYGKTIANIFGAPAQTTGSTGGNIAAQAEKFAANVGGLFKNGPSDPVTMSLKINAMMIEGIVNVFRMNHYGNDSSVAAIDFYNVGAQYVSNPGKSNLDRSYGTMTELFNGAIKNCGIDPKDLEAQSTRFTAEQRLQIRAAVADKFQIPDMAICLTDMWQVAKNAVVGAPPAQKQAVFNSYAGPLQSLYDQIVGNPYQKIPDEKGELHTNDGLMKTENSRIDQYNKSQVALASLAEQTGTAFVPRFDGSDPRLKKAEG